VVRVQLNNGQTLAFDLREASGKLAWESFQSGNGWQSLVTAMGINCHRTLYTLPIPDSELVVSGLGAGLIEGRPKKKILGEVVWFHVRDLKVELQVYSTNQKVVKVAVKESSRVEV
jgi:hypothetical protein